MSASLTLRYEFSHDDDFGWLAAVIETPKLQATGGFWVQWQDVEEWAAALAAAYPITADSPVEEDWGQSENGEYRSIIHIVIAPLDRLGQLRASVALADPHDPSFAVRTAFCTTYAELALFAADVTAMIARQREASVLTGRELV